MVLAGMIKSFNANGNIWLITPLTIKYLKKPVLSNHLGQCCRIFNKHKLFFSTQGKDTRFTMKLNTPEFLSIFTPELRKLSEIFNKHGYEIRVVGGAVRDLLDGKKPHDLDFATSATPDQMKEMFTKENVRMLNNKGEKHGTITPRINDEENFEVTTLRRDVSTDGRHAEVEFTTDWRIDAARRDLTINSMYLGLDGTVYDYFNGYEDLKERKVVFVGDSRVRIQEDYLRILRYFRFFGRISKNPQVHDESALKAIEENASGLANISGERIWSELSRILMGNFVEEIVKKMLDLGLGPFIGLAQPDELDIKYFENICRLGKKYHFKPITYVTALLRNETQVWDFHSRVKLSSSDRDLALFLITLKYEPVTLPKKTRLKNFQDLIICKKQRLDYILEFLRMKDEEELIEELQSWKVPIFPINGNILKAYGIKNGKEIGLILDKMRRSWIKSDFQLNKEDLLLKLPQFRKKGHDKDDD